MSTNFNLCLCCCEISKNFTVGRKLERSFLFQRFMFFFSHDSLLRSLFHPNLWCPSSPASCPRRATPTSPLTPATPPTPNRRTTEPSHLQPVPAGLLSR